LEPSVKKVADILYVNGWTAHHLEEALANAYVFHDRYPKRVPKAPTQSFMNSQPQGYRDFYRFEKNENFSYGKRLLGMLIDHESFWETQFRVKPFSRRNEVPVFLVRDSKKVRNSVQLFDKKRYDYGNSEFRLTNGLISYNQWTFEEIGARSEFLSEEALKLWRIS